ncbi:hypothetical protein J3458_004694 [Metarhizium acridum]|uniref:uncharacterized protein n=1 Tax=Metarhizium acridum TaxID=92637 RepID=UPI001C6B53AE|nr:hypothetical protein J3458_004694 [Metarhizium acridum]
MLHTRLTATERERELETLELVLLLRGGVPKLSFSAPPPPAPAPAPAHRLLAPKEIKPNPPVAKVSVGCIKKPAMPSKDAVDVPSFASTQLALLDRELKSEVDETSQLISNHSPAGLQRAGLAITNLVVSSQRTGLGGKTVLELGPDSATSTTGELPEHGIRTGDIVLVAEQPAGSAKKREVRDLERKGSRGVVTKVQRGFVHVALDDGKDEVSLPGRVWLVKLADEVTYKR